MYWLLILLGEQQSHTKCPMNECLKKAANGSQRWQEI